MALDIDKGWDKIVKELMALDNTYVKTGIQSNTEVPGKSITMAQLGAVHEFGKDIAVTDRMRGYLHAIGIHLRKDTAFIHIPQRSFIRSAYDENESDIKHNADIVVANILEGNMLRNQALDILGNYMQGLIQRKMVEGPFVPNSPMTIARKGSSRPLIDTGRLRQSIRYKIERGE